MRFLLGAFCGLILGAVCLYYQHKQVTYWFDNYTAAVSACDTDDRDTPDWSSPPQYSTIPNYPSTKNSPSVRSENSGN